MAILDNLMLEQEDARVARGWGSHAIELVEDDCVILHQPRAATLQSCTVTPSINVVGKGTTSTPLHTDSTPVALATTTKNLTPIMESQQLAMLGNTYNIHFEQSSNDKKKVNQIILHAMWKKVYAKYM